MSCEDASLSSVGLVLLFFLLPLVCECVCFTAKRHQIENMDIEDITRQRRVHEKREIEVILGGARN